MATNVNRSRMEARSVGTQEDKYWACLGCWITCYGPFSLGACFETYKPFISLIFTFFGAAVDHGH
jgi:hypothetical protein